MLQLLQKSRREYLNFETSTNSPLYWRKTLPVSVKFFFSFIIKMVLDEWTSKNSTYDLLEGGH